MAVLADKPNVGLRASLTNLLCRCQHRADRERKALAGRYAHLSRFVNDIVLLIDDHGKIVEANDRAAAEYGYSMGELLQLSIHDLLAQPEYPAPETVFATLERNGGAVFESIHRRKDGSTLQAEVSARRVDVDARNFHQTIIRDITERKHAEEQVRRSTRAMRVLSASNQALVRSPDEPPCSARSARRSPKRAVILWPGSVLQKTMSNNR